MEATQRRRLLLFVSLALATASTATAQDIQNFKPAVGTWNGFGVEGAEVPRHLEVVPSVVLNYGQDPLVFREGGDVDGEIVGHLATLNLLATIGFWDRVELGIDLPFHYADGDGIESGAVIGDVRLIPKIRLVGLSDGKGAGLALSVPVSFPTGDPAKFVGADQIIANPKLILEARGGGVRFAANGGIRIRPDKQTPENVAYESLELGTEVTYGAMLGVELGTRDVIAMLEGQGAATISDISADSRANPLEALLGLRIFTKSGPVFTLAGGTGIIADYGSPLFRVIAGLAYHNRNYDRDGDGIEDDVDRCPDDPEDKDGFEDQDGCPDPDNDQDGILDTVDACPLDPEDKDGFEDNDGCPDPDNDRDGILDVDDKCPDQPENINNFEDADGCPDLIPDTDGDGILDPDDQCPTEPEDKDGWQDEDGCPDPDNDSDRILDVNDKCPNEPETVNGFEDGDGCPDKGLVVVTKEKIEILQKVFFFTDKATIKKESYEVLNQVAAVLVGNPHLKRVRVEGHTDSQGKDKYNLDLSQRRSESVRAYLIAQGVAPDRLDAVGYGETVPIADNKTADGRAENRRVEFTILDQ